MTSILLVFFVGERGIYLSILHEYEMIRKGIGHDKFDSINEYLSVLCPKEQYEKYKKELQTISDLPNDKWVEKKKELENKYNVVYLSDILYKSKYWEKYEEWYNEQHLHRKVEIVDTWTSDYDDIRCNAILYENDKEVANIIASYDETDLRYSIGDEDSEMNDKFVKRAFKNLIYYEFDKYLELPKISECSKLLQEVYDNVCESDATMCHISDEDWENYYIDTYTENDLKILKEEIKKYGLENVIEIDTGEYKIIGYGDLETKFNDDDRFLQLKEDDCLEIW